MAIKVRFNAFIIRKASIVTRYPGGLERFRADWMRGDPDQKNRGEDDYLIGFCSMGWYFEDIIEKLHDCGLKNRQGNQVIDMVFGDELAGIEDGCDWLEVHDGGIGVKTCWLKGTTPGEIVEPILL